jgi:two-component SAPR family response regulator
VFQFLKEKFKTLLNFGKIHFFLAYCLHLKNLKLAGTMIIVCKKRFVKSFILLIIFAFSFSTLRGQIYGLYFSGNEVSKDFRTGLNLTHYQSFQFHDNIDLLFDLKLGQMDENEFGYIVRFTSDKNNIDLIYNKQSGRNEIVLVTGQGFSNISYDIGLNKKVNVWVKIHIKIDLNEDKLSISIEGNNYHTQNIGLKTSNQFNINFGAITNGKYAMTHVPPMSVRAIKILENNKLSYEWPLDESEGEIATDIINQRKAFITNPSWLIKKHYLWENIQKSILKGKVSITYESIDDNVIIIDEFQLWKYSVRDKSISQVRFKSGTPILNESVNGLCLPDSKTLFTFSVTDRGISMFDDPKGIWKDESDAKALKDDAIHYNKFYSKIDNTIWIIGGYSANTYRNSIMCYDIELNKWQVIQPTGEFFGPRFLAALGVNQTNDTAYVLGGYGSISGNSILNPHYYFELIALSTKDNKVHQIHKYSPSDTSFSFANSMIIDSKDKSFYALRFSMEKYIGELQLVKGSLKGSSLTEMASKIPYSFQEKRSYADLFFSKITQQLIAVTVFYNEKLNESEVNIYSLNAPPNISNEVILQKKVKGKAIYWIILIILFDFIIFVAYMVTKKLRNRRKKNEEQFSEVENSTLNINYIRQINSAEKLEKKNSIFLFGGFQVFDSEGNEISKMFTPLLKELFLIIVFYTYKNGKGIQSSKLTEMLWFDKSQEKAINNRSVNIGKLRNILNLIGDCELSNKTVYWTIDFGNKNTPIYFDFWEYKYLINQTTLDKTEIRRLISIIGKGALLPFTTYSWLDDFKEDISSKIIDKLLLFTAKPENELDKDLLIDIANTILIFDSVNEEAVKIKCKTLVLIGKHSSAKSTYDKFVNEYLTLYSIPYEISFKEMTDK